MCLCRRATAATVGAVADHPPRTTPRPATLLLLLFLLLLVAVRLLPRTSVGARGVRTSSCRRSSPAIATFASATCAAFAR